MTTLIFILTTKLNHMLEGNRVITANPLFASN